MPSPTVTFSPSESYESALNRALANWGIVTEFWDIWGTSHVVTPEGARRVLSSMGVRAGTLEELDAELEEALWREWSTPLPGTLVLSIETWDVPINIPAEMANVVVYLEYQWERGDTETQVVPLETLAAEGDAELRGRGFIRKRVPLPQGRPLGYHRLTVQIEDVSCDVRLILCPERAFYPEDLLLKRSAGLAVSVYSLRSGRNWGCGDFTDLQAFVDWAHDDLGCSFVSLNPLHAIPNRQPYNTSPYLPNCSFYRNPLYLDIERIDEFARTPQAARALASVEMQRCIAELRAAAFVEYEKVWHLKRRFLKLLFRAFLQDWKAKTGRSAEFERYIEREGKLLDQYATYCALEEAIHKQNPNIWIWPDWPAEYRDAASEETAKFARTHWRSVLFYKWVQWQVDQQLALAQRHARLKGMSIGLYHDLALATDRCGSDLWAHRPFYIEGCRVGAPPDGFSPRGQDWAFPPPNKTRHKENGYELFAQSIRKNCQHGGALRIDHVMRFFRLYWIPDGVDATQGIYVRDHIDDLLHILALESVRNEVIVIGEDLGTVEPGFREKLQEFGIFSYRLLYFERWEGGEFKNSDEYPRQSLVSVSTHDLPTLAGFWQNRDIEARRSAGLLPDDGAYYEQLRNRVQDKQKMLDLLHRMNLLPDYIPRRAEEIPEFVGDLHAAAIGFLARTPSQLMCLNQEDLLKDTDQQNLPGSTAEYPNWRHKMRFTLEELATDPLATGCSHMFRTWLEQTGRL